MVILGTDGNGCQESWEKDRIPEKKRMLKPAGRSQALPAPATPLLIWAERIRSFIPAPCSRLGHL